MGELYLGSEAKTGNKVCLTGSDRFGHMVIVGPTGCGKTSKIIKPGIWQDLIEIKRKRLAYKKLMDSIDHEFNKGLEKIWQNKTWSLDKKQEKIIKLQERKEKRLSQINKQDYVAGVTIVEPKGDLAEDVVKMCKKLKLNDYKYINPLNEDTDILNIMQGDPDEVAETNRTVLKNLFGKQEQFFALIQETTARNTILLIKKLRGDALDLIDVARALRDEDTLKGIVEKYEKQFGTDDLVQFFRAEVFGTLKDKYYQFALGLRQQLEDIGGNKYLKRVLIGNSTVNLDKHLEEGGILIVNTCMGRLGTLGDTFGEFVIMHLQNAIFRRPGNEWTRANHYIWIDEAPRYMNQDLERLLAIGRSYVSSANLSIQVGDQLVLSEKKEFAGILMANCRTKIVFGGVPEKDAKMFSEEFGKDMVNAKQYTYNYKSLLALPTLVPKSYRTSKQEELRFTTTNVMELKSKKKTAEAIIKYIKEGEVQRPVKIITKVGNYDSMPLEFTLGDIAEKLREKLWFSLKSAKTATEKSVEKAAGEVKAAKAKLSEKVDEAVKEAKANEQALNFIKKGSDKATGYKTIKEVIPVADSQAVVVPQAEEEECTYTFILPDSVSKEPDKKVQEDAVKTTPAAEQAPKAIPVEDTAGQSKEMKVDAAPAEKKDTTAKQVPPENKVPEKKEQEKKAPGKNKEPEKQKVQENKPAVLVAEESGKDDNKKSTVSKHEWW